MSNNSVIPIDDLALGDITMQDGEENMGGTAEHCYIALKSHIDTWPTLKTIVDGAELGDLVTLEGDFVMKDGKFFMKVEILRQTGKVSSENQGEDKGRSYINKAAFKIRGATKAEAAGLARLLNNSSGVCIMIDNDGNRIQIGEENHPAYFKPSNDTGEKPADRSEYTYEVEADSFCPVKHYTGVIPLSGGDSVPALS